MLSRDMAWREKRERKMQKKTIAAKTNFRVSFSFAVYYLKTSFDMIVRMLLVWLSSDMLRKNRIE